MIIGIGSDIIEISRIEELIDKTNDGLIKRVFTEREIAYCNSKRRFAQHFAVRFAAKEAILKALGTGFRDVSWHQMEIINDELGKPQVLLAGKAKEIAEKMKINSWHITLSHSEYQAVAFVIAENR